MPGRSPSYDLGPEVPQSASVIFGRSMQAFEALPWVTHKQSTAGLTLTTAAQAVPSLATSFAIPGNAYIAVDVVLDVGQGSTAGTIVGELWNQPPGGTLSSNGSSQQIISIAGPVNSRMTLGQVWTFLSPAPGTWHLSVQARRSSGSSASIQSVHSNMRVVVL